MIDIAAEIDRVGRGLDEIEARADESGRNPDVSAWGVAKARARLEKISNRTEEIAVASDRMLHFALGPLTAAEWVRFAAVHGDHHLSIVADVLSGE